MSVEKMNYEEKVKAVFIKITIFKLFFIITECGFLFSFYKNKIDLCILIIGLMLIVLITLFLNLWEAINDERLKQ